MAQIGISINDVEVGKEVYYYPWWDKHCNPEPKRTKIKSKPYEVSGQLTCFVEDVSGVVALSHLSLTYYPERVISRAKVERKERYEKYVRSESTLSFIDWLKNENYKRY